LRPDAFDAVLFDWGETLFYCPSGAQVLVEAGLTEERAIWLWNQVWQASKTPDALARGRDLSSSSHRMAWTALLEPVDAELPGMGRVLYERVIDTDAWLPYPDVPVVLRSLARAGVQVGVVSNVPGPLAPVFERQGLDALVSVFVESYRQGVEKPDPELFLAGCRELGVTPERTLMVGDSHLTDGAAVRAGLVTLLLPAVPPGAERGLAAVLRLLGHPDTPDGAGQPLR
jgi:HAD superfamily hydrolase (TIGR01509 family)